MNSKMNLRKSLIIKRKKNRQEIEKLNKMRSSIIHFIRFAKGRIVKKIRVIHQRNNG